jgi:hypothetical protein
MTSRVWVALTLLALAAACGARSAYPPVVGNAPRPQPTQQCFEGPLPSVPTAPKGATYFINEIPPREQWYANAGYCGEVAFASAGLYYGQYASQYAVRWAANRGLPTPAAQTSAHELLIGENDLRAAATMGLRAVDWRSARKPDADDFLTWMKGYVIRGAPVIVGVFNNECLLESICGKFAGDPDYDHIVPVIGIASYHPPAATYYASDAILFSDNGLFTAERGGNTKACETSEHQPPLYYFPNACSPFVLNQFSNFQLTRAQANDNGNWNFGKPVYSIERRHTTKRGKVQEWGRQFGVAITGVIDLNNETLPVRVSTDKYYECPAMINGSTASPPPEHLKLTITVSDLQPSTAYNLYYYNDFSIVPTGKFNKKAKQATKAWAFSTGPAPSPTPYIMRMTIISNDIAVYRAVPASGP